MQNRLDVDKERLSKIQQNLRDIGQFGEMNPFDFSDFKKEENEININEFSDIAENNKTKHNRTPIFEVITHHFRDIFS